MIDIKSLQEKVELLKNRSDSLSKKIDEMEDAAIAIQSKQAPEVARIDLVSHTRIVGAVENVCRRWKRIAIGLGVALLISLGVNVYALFFSL